ncbi:SDR family NAD(P)-dependent oxidoreductase [Nocardioides montaniterrae]
MDIGLLLQTPHAAIARVTRRVTGGASPLAGRTVMVTGASSGIGRATASAAAERGAHVLLVARRADDLAAVRAEIVAAGGIAETYPCDLTDGDAVDALVAAVTAEHGAVDYLVNNAGRSIRRSLDLSYDRFHDFERTMAINYFAPVRLTMGLLPAMREQRFGHVVNILSWGVQIKAPKFAAYLASKSALDVFSRIAGRETFFDNVTFTNMRVSTVNTAMTAPTESYAGKGLSPETVAERVVRALEDRPLTVNTLFADAYEVLNLVAPRLADLGMAVAHRRTPDSAAARGTLDRTAPRA